MTSTLQRTAGLVPMRPRDPHEPNRTASTLELFFDLTFVVAVSIAAHALLVAEQDARPGGIALYLAVFFGIWWAWMNFTWFASAFDTDDWLYRITTIVQMAGVLVLAAGVDPVVTDGDFRTTIVGYVVMRIAMVAQWLRAARDPEYRVCALRYGVGIAAVQVLWVVWLLAVPWTGAIGFVVLVAAELLVPAYAERAQVSPFHLHHIAERYGLFTLIVLGEGLLAITNALVEARAEEARGVDLVLLGATGLVLLAGMWWVYFARDASTALTTFRATFAFGYLHFAVFAAAAAVASGVELAIETTVHAEAGPEAIPEPLVRAATTVPVAVFLLAAWTVVLRTSLGRVALRAIPAMAVLVAASALMPGGLQIAALLVVLAVVVLEVDERSRTRATAPLPR